MRCKTCEANGVRHKVFVLSESIAKPEMISFYDENDHFHIHEHNLVLTDYKCSEEHCFRQESKFIMNGCTHRLCSFGRGEK